MAARKKATKTTKKPTRKKVVAKAPAKRKATPKQLAALAKARASRIPATKACGVCADQTAAAKAAQESAMGEIMGYDFDSYPSPNFRAGYTNPRYHYPKTSRGRKSKPRGYKIELLDSKGKLISRRKLNLPRGMAKDVAKALVGKVHNKKRIARVVLDGP